MNILPIRFGAPVFLFLAASCSSTGPQQSPAALAAENANRVHESGQSITTVHQFNLLMNKAAMNLASSFSFNYGGNIQELVRHSFWNDYTASYKVVKSKNKLMLTMNLTDGTRLLAAHRSPNLESQLSSREKKALRIARNIVSKCVVKGSDFDTIVKLHDYLIHEYVSDISGARDACSLLIDGRGNCWAYTVAMHLLLQMGGIPAHIVTGSANGGPHAWNIVQLNNGEWYHIDTTWDDPIVRNHGGGNIESHKFFLLCDEHMGLDHSWNRAVFPKSGHSHASYFKRRNIYFTSYEDFWQQALHAYGNGDKEFEGWLSHYDEAEFRASMQKVLRGQKGPNGCSWLPLSRSEGAVLVQFE